jgi:hypothetical protein
MSWGKMLVVSPDMFEGGYLQRWLNTLNAEMKAVLSKKGVKDSVKWHVNVLSLPVQPQRHGGLSRSHQNFHSPQERVPPFLPSTEVPARFSPSWRLAGYYVYVDVDQFSRPLPYLFSHYFPFIPIS